VRADEHIAAGGVGVDAAHDGGEEERAVHRGGSPPVMLSYVQHRRTRPAHERPVPTFRPHAQARQVPDDDLPRAERVPIRALRRLANLDDSSVSRPVWCSRIPDR
jgi:hypothetical protein